MQDMKKSTTLNSENDAGRTGRRSFFGRLLAAVGGGLVSGSVLRGFLGSRALRSRDDRSISLNTHPLAVPRSKEGSQSNV
jgi:hypothetical protein